MEKTAFYRGKVLIFVLTVLMISGISGRAHAAGTDPEDIGKYVKHKMTEFTGELPDVIEENGVKYEFSHMEKAEREKKTYTAVSEEILKNSGGSIEFDRETEIENVRYELIHTEEACRVETGRTLMLEEKQERDAKLYLPVSSVWKSAQDPVSKEPLTAELPLAESVYIRDEWLPDLETVLDFSPAEADYYIFMGESIERDAAVPLPEDLWQKIPEFLGLSEDSYRITEVAWVTGEDGASDHTKACIKGESRHRIYLDTFRTEVMLPDLEYAVQTAYYEEADEDYEAALIAEGTAVYVLSEEKVPETLQLVLKEEPEAPLPEPKRHGYLTPALAGLLLPLLTGLAVVYMKKKSAGKAHGIRKPLPEAEAGA